MKEQLSIYLLNDIGKNTSLESLFNLSTDEFTINRKHKTPIKLPFEKSPKVVITTNHIIKQVSGSSSERRKYEIELSDYFGLSRTPADEFGHLLFDDWESDSIEWHHYFNFIFYCVQYYLTKGLVNPPKINIENRKLMAEVGEELIDFLDEKISEGKTKFYKQDLYHEFVASGAIVNRNYLPNRNTFTRKVKLYFSYKGLPYKEEPIDTKKYFVLLNEKSVKELTERTIDCVDVNYNLVDTERKAKKVIKQLKNS